MLELIKSDANRFFNRFNMMIEAKEELEIFYGIEELEHHKIDIQSFKLRQSPLLKKGHSQLKNSFKYDLYSKLLGFSGFSDLKNRISDTYKYPSPFSNFDSDYLNFVKFFYENIAEEYYDIKFVQEFYKELRVRYSYHLYSNNILEIDKIRICRSRNALSVQRINFYSNDGVFTIYRSVGENTFKKSEFRINEDYNTNIPLVGMIFDFPIYYMDNEDTYILYYNFNSKNAYMKINKNIFNQLLESN